MALAVALLLGIFVVMALLLRQAEGTALDVAITRGIQQLDHPAVAALMVSVSAIGYRPWSEMILAGAVVACLAARWYPEVVFVLLTQGAGWLATCIKLAVERPRPTSPLVQVLGTVGETSYPSGHVTSYVVVYGLLFFFIFVRMRRSWLRTGMLMGLAALIMTVGVSRIYLGHHWASDVIGGYVLGGAYLLLLLEAYRWLVLPALTPARPLTEAAPSTP